MKKHWRDEKIVLSLLFELTPKCDQNCVKRKFLVVQSFWHLFAAYKKVAVSHWLPEWRGSCSPCRWQMVTGWTGAKCFGLDNLLAIFGHEMVRLVLRGDLLGKGQGWQLSGCTSYVWEPREGSQCKKKQAHAHEQVRTTISLLVPPPGVESSYKSAQDLSEI